LNFLFNSDGIMPALTAAVAGTVATKSVKRILKGRFTGRPRRVSPSHAVAPLTGAGGLAVDATRA
jgi:hypothetical protein